ncbi:RluA family pseudouridine synthase [Pleionea litopenaei]|uniref:RluA family pseudouridine synthase n=1 Tax=Pleionea litopenaei TaxID=3070815 RepID=A0AA51RV10_9GAMM|nr:RluA family pseudouridine synthase [Pleionea sp. HL-JVS1]WMS88221.1 RluA family pseudouridine synthase [Pleionea sp. HL-JVS1]
MISLSLDRFIHYLDDDLVVINKPAGMPSVPGKNPHFPHNLYHWLQNEMPPIYVVHRLDTNTSGLIVFARTRRAQSLISQQFQNRHINKTYFALVQGRPKQNYIEVHYPIASDWPRRPLQKLDWNTGKPCLTQLIVAENRENHTLVELHPITGRSHQLRIHCALLGLPIVGCELYATPDPGAFGRFIPPLQVSDKQLHLHAAKLEITQPTTAERLIFEATAEFMK